MIRPGTLRAAAPARASFAFVLACAALAVPLRAPSAQEPLPQGVRIGLTYAAGVRPGVYVLPMSGPHADSIRAIIARDLDYGNRVTVIAPDSGLAPTGALNYPLFARLGAAAVLQLSVTANGGVRAVVHEVGATRVLQTAEFPLGGAPLSAEWRLSVHGVADEIERWITGARGIAATRILFVRGGTLWLVDSDGANPHRVPGVDSGLDPAWHPSGTRIAYFEMLDDGTHVIVHDLESGRRRRVSTPGGTNASPTFSPDGRTIVWAAGEDEVDLVSLPLEGNGRPFRITVGRTTNSQPSFAPDGRRIAFTSSRLGRPEIYITDADGANAELLTTSGFGDQLYRSDPSWSPDGRFVAFSTQIEGRFQIATIGLRNRAVKQHTVDGINEDPHWAPDARHLVFTSNRSGSRQLWVLDTESGRMRQLTFGAPARMGAWSPRLSNPR
jgi:TolB protein